MAQKIEIPGQVNPAPKIAPSVSGMVEMIWNTMPNVANGLNQIAYMVHSGTQRVAQLQMAELENTYLLKHLSKALGVELPPLDVIRKEIATDKLEFLKSALATGTYTDEQKAELKKQIEELELGLVEPPPVSAPAPGEPQTIAPTGIESAEAVHNS